MDTPPRGPDLGGASARRKDNVKLPRALHRSPSTRLDLVLWLFSLGWLRVALDPSADSIVVRILDPQGAGNLAVPATAILCILGAIGVLGSQIWATSAFLVISAAWWTVVSTLIYLATTPVPDGPRALSYLPTDSGSYAYALIAVIATSEAVFTIRRERGRAA